MKEFYCVYTDWGEYYFQKEENAIAYLWNEYLLYLHNLDIVKTKEELDKMKEQLDDQYYIDDVGEIKIVEFDD